MEIYGVIYQIYCSANGKVYIGQAVDVDRRWETHLWMLENNKHHNEHLQNAWRKYSSSAFEWTVKCDCFSQRDMNALEIHYIKQAGENCFNATMGGESSPMLGKKHSEETRRKLSEANRGKVMSEEARRKIGNYRRGKLASEETRRKMSDSGLGKSRSEETRRKISISLSGTNSPLYGKPISAETIAKRTATRAANDGYRRSAETIAKYKATRAANKLRKAQALEAQ